MALRNVCGAPTRGLTRSAAPISRQSSKHVQKSLSFVFGKGLQNALGDHRGPRADLPDDDLTMRGQEQRFGATIVNTRLSHNQFFALEALKHVPNG
jgi:hypothetical protein